MRQSVIHKFPSTASIFQHKISIFDQPSDYVASLAFTRVRPILVHGHLLLASPCDLFEDTLHGRPLRRGTETYRSWQSRWLHVARAPRGNTNGAWLLALG